MNLAILAMKGREMMTKEAKKADIQRSVGYDYAMDPSNPMHLGIGANRSGESARALAMSLGTGGSLLGGAVTGSVASGLLGNPSHKVLTRKGRKQIEQSLTHDAILGVKAAKNISKPTNLRTLRALKDVKPWDASGAMNKLTKSRSMRKAFNALKVIRKKRTLRKIGLGGLSGAGISLGANALGNLIAYETGRGLSPTKHKTKVVKVPKKNKV